jgi:peptide/nickel transport system permease protein
VAVPAKTSSPEAVLPEAEQPVYPSRGYWRTVRRMFWRRRVNRIAAYITLGILFVGLTGNFIASDLPLLLHLNGKTYVAPCLLHPGALRMYNNQIIAKDLGPNDWAIFPPVPWGYNTHDLSSVLQAPSARHWLGTDPSGRDVMSRCVYGTRVSILVGVFAVAILVFLGVLLGGLAGYYGRWVDILVVRVIEVVQSIPYLLLIVVMLAILNPQGWSAVLAMMVVIGLVGWTGVARLIRGEILKVKKAEYVQAVRALGGSDARIIIRHIIPNSISPVLVSATFAMASAILIVAALSFLGYGIPPDMASWGGILNQARSNLDAWWLAVFPGFAIFITVTVYNLLGEGLRDAIDPKLKT